jgi:diguanylate cyclase (GGDEF)-like protein
MKSQSETEPQNMPLTALGVRRRFLGLQLKFTVLVLFLVVAVAALVGGAFVEVATELANHQKREQCLQSARMLAESASILLENNDKAGLVYLAEAYVQNGPMLFANIVDPLGNPIAVSDPAGACGIDERRPGEQWMVGVPSLVSGTRESGPFLHVSYPIRLREETGHASLMGYVHVGLSVQRTLQNLTTAFDLFSGMGIAILLLTIPLAYLLVRCVVVPINELSRVVSRFAQGDLKARSSVNRNDEIGVLALSFNSMANEIADQHEQISRLNSDLEQRVNERTKQLRELASRDSLTGLYNRRHFADVSARRFYEAKRYGLPLACIMIDLDDFKAINDTFGHHVGDEILILAATTIASQLRAADVAARFGGDEFILLLPQTDATRAAVLGRRIAEKFAQDLAEQMPKVQVGLSFGVAAVDSVEANEAEDMIRAADRAMYDLKYDTKSLART